MWNVGGEAEREERVGKQGKDDKYDIIIKPF